MIKLFQRWWQYLTAKLSGVLAEAYSWRYAFYMIVPAGIPANMKLMPRVRSGVGSQRA